MNSMCTCGEEDRAEIWISSGVLANGNTIQGSSATGYVLACA
jgi:hypothetical protein